MGTRHRQTVITKEGEQRISQYGQWDGYPSCQGVEILKYLINGDLDKYQNNLKNINPITQEDSDEVNKSKEWKIEYPYLSRDCGYGIHQMIEDGSVKYVDLIGEDEANKWCEGFYTIDFQSNKFISDFHGIEVEFDLDKLPTEEEYLKYFKGDDE